MTNGLSVERVGRVLHLVLDAPERRNALSRPMLAALLAQLSTIDTDTTGVVISGRDAGFSAGADFRDLTGSSADLDYDEAVSAVREAIAAAPCVVAAALEGPCLGAAADLALTCDLRVAAEDCYLQIPAVRLGLFYNPAALWRAVRSFPGDSIRRLFLLGERFSAADAQAAGLITHVVPAGQAASRAIDLLGAISPSELTAITTTKAFLEACLAGEPGTRPPQDEEWQRRRRELLDSPARRAAVDAARARHAGEDEPAQDNPTETEGRRP